jgi:CMP-N,N'-diacetyllegionaminic acid synthase
MKILITICGRGGSKGIPGKNIKKLNGVPLIAYSIHLAKQFALKYDADITISTDDVNIKDTAASFGITTNYIRSAVLATDEAGKIPTIYDVLIFEELSRKTRYDYILDLAICSPLRTLKDIEEAFTMINNDNSALNLFSVSIAKANPYFNLVEKNSNNYYSLIKKSQFLTRQSTPLVYELNGAFYFYKRSFFDLGLNTVMTDFSLIYLIKHITIDLDQPNDFEYLDYLIQNNKIDFFNNPY